MNQTAMTMRELLSDIEIVAGDSALDIQVDFLAYDSRKVQPGAAFFCIKGHQNDGHTFGEAACDRGARVLVVESVIDCLCPQIVVGDARRALAFAANHFCNKPSEALAVVGITGTNGKTTTTYILDSIFRAHNLLTGVIGTVETRIGQNRIDATRTTPESSDLQALLADMVSQEVKAVSMEVSSHAIDLHRIDGVHFGCVAFTNLTQDHLDYHNSMGEYYEVKKRLFTQYESDARVINVDTAEGVRLASELGNSITVGRSLSATIRAENERPAADGTQFTLVTPDGSSSVSLPLAGAYNVSNALVAAGCAYGLGIDRETIVAGLSNAPQVVGRLQRVEQGQRFSVVVDYAHTSDALENALAALRAVTQGRLIVVFGCGGDRDPAKRPLMGKAATTNADYVVATSDNPRSEDPVSILLQIEDGLKSGNAEYRIEVDRKHAIGHAITMAKPGDCVLIAGKGHESYQIFADHTVHFDDCEVATAALSTLGYVLDSDKLRDLS